MNAGRGAGSVAHRRFAGDGGSEHFITVTGAGGDFAEQLRSVEAQYAETRRELGLAPETAVFRRLFVSDLQNQAAALRASALAGDGEDDGDGGPVAVSVVEQPPLPRGKLALLAYHVAGAPLVKHRLTPHHLLVRRNGRRHLWSTGLCAGADESLTPAETQTQGIFEDLAGALAGQGGSLARQCLRTWIYIKDVDLYYQPMVDGRRVVYVAQGMVGDAHTMASTAVGGACAHRYDLVMVDAYSALDLAPGQVSFLNDPDRMCATTLYNVQFERGTRVDYADRAHVFVSGTASIDTAGRVVHVGDVGRQLDRALGNLEAVLQAGGATPDDLMYLFAYLRDPADYPLIRDRLAERLPGLPLIPVRAPICRPQWLVEVEGFAIAGNDAPALPGF